LNAVVHKLAARVLVVAGALALAPTARAAEVTRVVSALDDENRFDFNVTAAWLHESWSSFIKRESATGESDFIKELEYGRTRDLLDFRLDFGILWDVGLHVDLPLVLADNRHLDFDQSAGSGCTFPPIKPATCVDQRNSTFLADGILPSDPATGQFGLDSRTGKPFNGGTRVFRGPTRSGLENLGIGVTWAVFNQLRDDTRPTWTLSFDTRLDIFKDMRFDPANPGANTAVGPGYHQFIWPTFVSKRFRYFDPYFGAWYMLPVRTNGSIYNEIPNGNQTAVNPMQRAGFTAGVEQIAWENPRSSQRVTVELRGRAEEHFYGRSASELWEPLSGASSCSTMTPGTPGTLGACRPGIDGNLPDGTGPANFSPYPGVTETQSYATFGGDTGLNVQVGKYVRFRGLFGLTFDMPHFITFSGTGVDRDPAGSAGHGRVDSSNPNEANALYRDAIDSPGRRFRVEGTQIWSLFLEGSIMF
jgi:hypothetical protein